MPLSLTNWPVRAIGPAILTVLLLAAPLLSASVARAAGSDNHEQAGDHQQAMAALGDVKAAISQILEIDASYSTDKDRYHHAAQSAIDAILGQHGQNAGGTLPQGADAEGAVGHIEHLLDRKDNPVWADALRGADANLQGAVAMLKKSMQARELMDFQIAASRALADLEMARGRASDTGVLGGLEGALSNTVLGVPDGATTYDACASPDQLPAYGVHDGALATIALPPSDGTHPLDGFPGIAEVSKTGSAILLHTAAAKTVAQQCAPKHAANASGAGLPALYTEAQAETGKGLFMVHCASCHGMNLAGVSAPSVAGTDFLSTAKKNGWTLKIIRYLVFEMMPFNAAGTLSNDEYANLMAFLLASNCYPAGSTPFPTEDKPEFATIQLEPHATHDPDVTKAGVCPVS